MKPVPQPRWGLYVAGLIGLVPHGSITPVQSRASDAVTVFPLSTKTRVLAVASVTSVATMLERSPP